MIDLLLIGIGTGNPEHLTLQAMRALNSADLVLIPRKGAEKSDLADLRRTICAEMLTEPAQVVEFDLPERGVAPDYLEGVSQWHDAIAAVWGGLMDRHLPRGGRVALMVWGDPALYDSSLRIADRLRGGGLAVNVTVIPGITSLQMLTAAHAIPLNTLAAPFLVTTGRCLRAEGWPGGVQTMVVMLDGGCAFQSLRPDGLSIFWAAYLGMPQEIRLSGQLAEVGPRIVAAREEARRKNGWIMDIYLLRRGSELE